MKKRIHINLDEELWQELKKQKVNMSDLVQTLLREYIATKKLQKELPGRIEDLERTLDKRLVQMEKTLLEGLHANKMELNTLNETFASLKKGLSVIAYWVAHTYHVQMSKIFCALQMRGPQTETFRRIWENMIEFARRKAMALYGHDVSETIYELRNSEDMKEMDKLAEIFKKELEEMAKRRN